MPFFNLGGRLLLLGAILVGALVPAPAQAQRPPRVATRIDSLRAARDGAPNYFPAQVTFTSGKQVQAYLLTYSTCFLGRVECYDTSPERLPRPALKALDVDRVKEMTVDGHRYESLYLKGKPLGLLAENLAPPGPVELFGYAKTKNDMLIPIPLPGIVFVVSTGTHEKYYWYVRHGPGTALREVPRGGGDFAKEMGAFFAAVPDLAARVGQKDKGARFEDVPALVQAYNERLKGR